MTPEQENDRLNDTSNSDAAANNARELENMTSAGRRPNELENDNSEVAGEDADRKVRIDDETYNDEDDSFEDEDLESVEDISNEDEETLSGSTNLSLDELKKEQDPAGFDDDDGENDEGVLRR